LTVDAQDLRHLLFELRVATFEVVAHLVRLYFLPIEDVGKRGRRGGADMTAADAANLFTALLIVRASSVPQSNIVSLTKAHEAFKAYDPHSDHLVLGEWENKLGLPELCKLKKGHTFGEAFSKLIASMSNGDFERAVADWDSRRPRGKGPYFQVTVSITTQSPYAKAHIEFDSPAFDRLHLVYLEPTDAQKLYPPIVPDAPRKWADLDVTEFDLKVMASVTEQSLAMIGTVLAGDEYGEHGPYDHARHR
jgi:hypothetical protein